MPHKGFLRSSELVQQARPPIFFGVVVGIDLGCENDAAARWTCGWRLQEENLDSDPSVNQSDGAARRPCLHPDSRTLPHLRSEESTATTTKDANS